MNHRQLQMRIRVINRDTAVFCEQHQEEGNAGQHACYRQVNLIRTQLMPASEVLLVCSTLESTASITTGSTKAAT